MQKQRRREYKMLKGLDKLEKKQDVQEKYNEWRRKAERENHMQHMVDCAFEAARIDFSRYCELEDLIPFEIMCWCETEYEKIIKFL